MANINFNIPNTQLPRIIAAMNGLYTKDEGFTDNQWAKEAVRRLIVSKVREWEQRLATAVAMTVVPKDDTLLS